MIAASLTRELERVFSRPSRAFERLSNGLEVRGKGTPPGRELLVRIAEDAQETPGGNTLAGLARAAGFEDWQAFRLATVAVAWVVEVRPGEPLNPEQIIEARGMRGRVLEPGPRRSVIAPGTLDRGAEAERIVAALMRHAEHLTPHARDMRFTALRSMSLEGLQLEARTFARGRVAAQLGITLAKAMVNP